MKVAIFIHSDFATPESGGRVLNGLHAALEFKQAGDYVDIIFDGSGTRAAVMLADESHHMHALFKDIEDSITGICRFCAGQQQVLTTAQQLGFPLLDDNHQHPSFRNYLINGYEIINF